MSSQRAFFDIAQAAFLLSQYSLAERVFPSD
jgi:hypothetical protein